MKLARWLVVACIAVSVSWGAAGGDEITGTVLDSQSGQPIHGARVTATLWQIPEPSRREVLVVLTGEDGRFRFTGLPQGECEIWAQKVGYRGDTNQGYSSRNFRIRPETSWAPFTMRLTSLGLGTITVSIVDDGGFSVAGAQIRIAPGPERLFTAPFDVRTGKDGTYRVRLPHGSYRIEALSPGNATLLRAQGLTFLPVYFPGTTDPRRAEWIDMRPGQEFHAEIRITPIPGREIRGHCDVSGTLMGVSLLPAGNDNYRVTWGLVQFDRKSGDFRISGVAPGIYVLTLEIQLPGISGTTFRKTVQILDADVSVLVSAADRLVIPRR